MTVKLSPDTEKKRSGTMIFFTSNLSCQEIKLYLLFCPSVYTGYAIYIKFLSIYIIFCIFSNPVGCYDIVRNVLRRESLEIFILQTLAHMPLVFVIFLYF